LQISYLSSCVHLIDKKNSYLINLFHLQIKDMVQLMTAKDLNRPQFEILKKMLYFLIFNILA